MPVGKMVLKINPNTSFTKVEQVAVCPACSFKSIFGTFEGHRIYASRKVAEEIEIQTRYAAELYNVDVRQDQRYMAEKDLFPCGDRDESRFSPDFQVPLCILGMEVAGDPNLPREISYVQVLNGCKQRFEWPISSTPSTMPYKRARIPPDRLSGCKSTYDNLCQPFNSLGL